MSKQLIMAGDGGTVPPSWLQQRIAAGAGGAYLSALGAPEKANLAGRYVERAGKMYQPWLTEEERENLLDVYGTFMYGLSLVYVESLEAMAAGEVGQ